MSVATGPDGLRWRRLSTLFDELVELPERERVTRLRELAAAEPAIVPELERLLAADARRTELLDRPLAIAPAPEPEGALPGPMPERAGIYRIVGALGRGGMAEVFAGERDDGAFSQRVAVKVLRRGLDTEDLLARFSREREILARLDHPAISRLLDAGRLADGRPFLVMERVEGEPIHRYVARRELAIEDRLRLLLVACNAVAFAHRNLVVHRDLKPSNVLVTGTGTLKLLDFGIAKLLEPESTPHETIREARLLTPAYAAPEQLAGAPTTTATDVWGLGALAYELLVGEPPSRGLAGALPDGSRESIGRAPSPRPSERVRELRGDTAAGREWAARLAGDVDTIVDKALAVDPAGRYSSVEALGADLARHLAGEPVLARPASIAYRLAKFAHRHRAGVAAAALVVASLAIGGGIALWQARVAARERARPLPSVRFLTYSGHDSMPVTAPDGRTVAFRSLRDGRSRIWTASLATGDERPVTDGDDRHPRFSPDGSELLFARAADDTSALLAVSTGGGRPRELFADAIAGDYSPDGTRIAFVRQRPGDGDVDSVVLVGAISGGEARELARLGGRALHPPRWSPDGRAIAVTASSLGIGERTSIALVDAENGSVRRLALDGSSPRGLAWVGAERLIVARPDDVTGWITGGSSRLLLHDLASGAVRTVLASATSIASFDRLAAGRLVFTSGSFRVNLREVVLDAGAPGGRWLTRGDASDRQPAFSPDGREAVFSSSRGGNLDLWIVTLATGAARRVTHDPALDWDPAFTADGDLLWSTNRSGTFEIWRAAPDGANARQITRDGVGAENPGATPDGSWLVYSSRAPQRRGIVRARLDGSGVSPIAGGELFLPELSPDGRLVAYLDLGGARPVLRIAEVATGRPHAFVLPLRPSDPGDDPDAGRCRWFPDGRSLAVLERDVDGSYVVTRRFLDGSPGDAVRIAAEPGHAAESFGIAPGGDRLLVAFWDTTTNLMLAENVPGVGP